MPDDYEKRVKEMEKRNEKYLQIFEDELVAKGLTEKTIRGHIQNVDLLLNEYMPRYEDHTDLSLSDGMICVYSFFSFFIRKCMWSTPAGVKKLGASLKKFFKCMMEHGLVEKEEYDDFVEALKDGIPEYMAECAAYNEGYDYYF